MAEYYSIMYMYHNFFIHSSVNRHLGCFHALAIVNSAAMNNGIHVSLSILVSSGYMPRSGIAGSYGGFILIFLRYFHSVFQSGCINFQPQTQQASYYAWFCPLVILMEYIMNKTMLLSQDSCISRRIFLIKKAELVSAVHKMNRTISLEMPRFYCLH